MSALPRTWRRTRCLRRFSSGLTRAFPTSPAPGSWQRQSIAPSTILRRNSLLDRKHQEIGHELEVRQEASAAALEAAVDDPIGDDLLRLIFICCHPILSAEARAALTLRLLGGLTTDEIARAFLVSEPTVAQRIVRAKRTLADARVPFEVPRGAELAARLASVLEVIYLIFNEGYCATAGDHWMRTGLTRMRSVSAAYWLNSRHVKPEVHGLVALMEIQASRAPARVGPSGEPVLLFQQNRALWNQLLIRRGLAALDRAESSAALGPTRCKPPSPPAMRERGRRRRRIGSASWGSMRRLARSRPPR